MAKYLEIRNENGLLQIDDESSVIQTLALSKNINYTQFIANAVDTTDSYKPPSPYQCNIYINPFTDIYGHENVLKADSTSAKMFAFRIIGDISNPPYAYFSYSTWTDANPQILVYGFANQNTPFTAQLVWLSLEPYNVPLPNTAFVAYNEIGEITFDAALGYVHHIASKTGKINVASQSSSFSIMVKDISGLGIDTSKLFLVMRGAPRVAQWQGSGNSYRVGYRTFTPRLRVTNNVIYVDFGIWMPYDYTGSIAAIYNPGYNFSIYYIPSIRSY